MVTNGKSNRGKMSMVCWCMYIFNLHDTRIIPKTGYIRSLKTMSTVISQLRVVHRAHRYAKHENNPGDWSERRHNNITAVTAFTGIRDNAQDWLHTQSSVNWLALMFSCNITIKYTQHWSSINYMYMNITSQYCQLSVSQVKMILNATTAVLQTIQNNVTNCLSAC